MQCSLVTVTGRELLAQSNCLPLIRLLCSEGFEVYLKSSGVLSVVQVHRRVSIVLNLKTAGSGESHRNDWNNPSAIFSEDQIKPVMSGFMSGSKLRCSKET